MEFHIQLSGQSPDPTVIEKAIRIVDASALVDIDPASPTLRVATSIDAGQLIALIVQAGCPVTPAQLTQLPSICCGGCSG